jgi:hypothetical protein
LSGTNATFSGNVGIGSPPTQAAQFDLFGGDQPSLLTYSGFGNRQGSDLLFNSYRLPNVNLFQRVSDIVSLGDEVNGRESIIRFITTNTSNATNTKLTILGSSITASVLSTFVGGATVNDVFKIYSLTTSAGVVLQGYTGGLRIAVNGSGETGGTRGDLLAASADFSSTLAVTGAATFLSSVTATTLIFKDAINSNSYGFRGLSGIVTLDGGSVYPTGWNFQYGGGSSSALYINGSGNVGIGTSSPTSYASTTLQVNGSSSSASIKLTNTTTGAGNANGLDILQSTTDTYFYNRTTGMMVFGTSDTERMRINSNGNISINYAGDAGYKLYVSGAIYATGNITANSDLTLKKNLKLIDNPIDKLMQLNGYAYQWKANDEYQYGVIAQEVEKVLPYAVQTGNNKIKGVAYNQLTPLLIEGFKSHESEITILKARVKYLESKLA